MTINPTGRYILPEFRERSATGERIHNPYTKLFEERIIFLGVQIDDASADDVMAQLLCLESMDPDRDIQIYINSPGGSYTAMTAIYDTIQFVKPQVQTVCLGQAASAAAVLLAAGTPGKRFALPHARILIHQPYTEGGAPGTSGIRPDGVSTTAAVSVPVGRASAVGPRARAPTIIVSPSRPETMTRRTAQPPLVKPPGAQCPSRRQRPA